MNKAECTELIEFGKARFREKIPEAKGLLESTEIILITNRNRAAQRVAVFSRYQAEFKEDSPTMLGEAVEGARGTCVLLYPQKISDQGTFFRVLWHEFGHVLDSTVNWELLKEASDDLENERDTPLRNGYGVWSECIAESISIFVEDAPPQTIVWARQDELIGHLKSALANGYVLPAELGLHFAMLLMDNTIDSLSEKSSIGWDLYSDEIIHILDEIACAIADQFNRERFWAVDRPFIEKLGKGFDQLWDENRKSRSEKGLWNQHFDMQSFQEGNSGIK